jgi:hypothetical protein
VKYLFIFLFVLILQNSSWAVTCPENSYEVNYNSSTNQTNIDFCQYGTYGNYIKNGPEVITDLTTGKIISQKNYKDGVETKAIALIKENGPSSCQKELEFFEGFYKELKATIFSLVGLQIEKNVISFDIGIGKCPHDANNRLNFMFKNIPYSWKMTIKNKCFFEGSIDFEFDKDKNSQLIFSNINNFNKLNLNYKIIKNTIKDDQIELIFQISNSKIYGDVNAVEFDGNIKILANMNTVKSSFGKQGVTAGEGKVNISKINSSSCPVTKDLFKD